MARRRTPFDFVVIAAGVLLTALSGYIVLDLTRVSLMHSDYSILLPLWILGAFGVGLGLVLINIGKDIAERD